MNAEIVARGGWISFAEYMHLVLYAPGLGYYASGTTKFGEAGDFITAPELSPLFARAVARQLADILRLSGGSVLELGAGTGKLAGEVVSALAEMDSLPAQYAILEPSPELRQRQKNHLLEHPNADRFCWLTSLPSMWTGVIFGNEVLDAIPCELVATTSRGDADESGHSQRNALQKSLGLLQNRSERTSVGGGCTTGTAMYNGVHEDSEERPIPNHGCVAGFERGLMVWQRGVRFGQSAAEVALLPSAQRQAPWEWENRALKPDHPLAVRALERFPSDQPNYLSEINLQAEGLVRSLGSLLKQGALLFFDYGFPAAEYYHPQRCEGTLRCHYRHHAHGEPFWQPGLNDITSHVDFTAIAEAATEVELMVAGFTNQAQFLINCGILDDLGAAAQEHEQGAYLSLVAGAQKLLSPAEMGELFKVICLSKGIGIEPSSEKFGEQGAAEHPAIHTDSEWLPLGFRQGNQIHRL